MALVRRNSPCYKRLHESFQTTTSSSCQRRARRNRSGSDCQSGKLINVYSGEILEGMEIAVIDGRICYVGGSAQAYAGQCYGSVGCLRCFVSPGFIDAHTHIGHYARPIENLQAFCRGALRRWSLPATNWRPCSASRLGTVFRGSRKASAAGLLVGVHGCAAGSVALQHGILFDDEIAQALADPRVLGMGEIVSWLRLFNATKKFSIVWG